MAVRNLSQSLRARFKRASAPERSRKKSGFTFTLSGLTMLTLGIVLVAAVAWAYFMGFMVGRGQNPEQRMAAMLEEDSAQRAALAQPHALQQADVQALEQAEAAAPDAAAPDAAAPDAVVQDTPLAGGKTHVPSAQAAKPAPLTASAPSVPPTGGTAAQAALPQQAPVSDMPFARPQGESLAAWGITPAQGGAAVAGGQAGSGGAGQGVQSVQGKEQAGKQESAQAARSPRFDFVFQVAAFRDKADAQNLRQKLEEHGLRTVQKNSGKLVLVLVRLRGTQLEADNLMVEMQRMKLGKPMQLSKKVVPAKGRP